MSFLVFFRHENTRNLDDFVRIQIAIETLDVGIRTGLVWSQVGSHDTQTNLSESIGVFFLHHRSLFCAARFPIDNKIGAEQNRVIAERFNGLYEVLAARIAMVKRLCL